MRYRVQRRSRQTLIAVLTAAAVSGAMLWFPGHSRGAGAAVQSSVNVVVVPAFAPQHYPGYFGVPPLPTPQPYHFSQLSANKVTTAALKNYDTVILYGIRWSDIPASGQAAINTFAATHKVLIWDADGTGSQSYASFLHPFSETASGENYKGKVNDSVAKFVTYQNFTNFLASDNPSSPYYLDPNQLITDRDEMNDMDAMTAGTKNWDPALEGANKEIPNLSWALAWSYGVIKSGTGLTIYSGIDADSFANGQLDPNYVLKELALQLQAPFRTTPAPCDPNCGLPQVGPPRPPHVHCSFAKEPPRHWIHGALVVWLKTSIANGITGKVVTHSGRLLANGKEQNGLIRFRIQTRRLRTNHISRLQALAFLDRVQACTPLRFRLKVDNTPPRLLFLVTSRTGGRDLLQLRVSELSAMTIVGAHVPHHRPVLIAAHRTIQVHLPARVRRARLILRDRAGNRLVRTLVWP